MLKKIMDGSANIKFVALYKITGIISFLLVLGSIALTGILGLNFGVDFTGGTAVEVRITPAADVTLLRSELSKLNMGEISIQQFGAPEDLLIRVPTQKGDAAAQKAATENLQNKIVEIYKNADIRRVEFVGPQVGDELKTSGFIAFILALASIMAYVTFRFEWPYGVASIVALFHDCAIAIGFFAITQIEFTLSTLAAVLLIAGYSMNDTVVVFDRIRENIRKYKKMPMPELLDKAINETLSRTTLTSLTMLLSLVALVLFGGEVIRSFSYALLIGIAVGTYSSIFIAAPLLLRFPVRRTKED